MTFNAKRQGWLQLSPEFEGLFKLMEKFNIIFKSFYQLSHPAASSLWFSVFSTLFPAASPDKRWLLPINRQHTCPPSASCWRRNQEEDLAYIYQVARNIILNKCYCSLRSSSRMNAMQDLQYKDKSPLCCQQVLLTMFGWKNNTVLLHFFIFQPQ